MKILKFLLLGLAALIALVVIVGLFLPDSVHLERDTVIQAPPSTVFALLNSFKRANDWSPWAQIDPEAVYTHSGPDQGVGAKNSWQSEHPDVGVGSQEITESTPYESIKMYLDFGPQGDANAFFDLTPKDGGTHVSWGFDSEFGMNIVGRYFGLVLEGILGPQYEEGLANLKTLAESLPPADFSDLESEVLDIESQTLVYFRGISTQATPDIVEDFEAAYGAVESFIAEHSLEVTGPPLAINTLWEDNTYGYDAGSIVTAGPQGEVAADSPVQVQQMYAGKVLRAVHYGSYDDMPQTYDQIEAFVATHGYAENGDAWDVWITDPDVTPVNELISHIYYPIIESE